MLLRESRNDVMLLHIQYLLAGVKALNSKAEQQQTFIYEFAYIHAVCHVYIYIYIYIYVSHVMMYIYIYIYIYMYICTYTHIHTYLHTCIMSRAGRPRAGPEPRLFCVASPRARAGEADRPKRRPLPVLAPADWRSHFS